MAAEQEVVSRVSLTDRGACAQLGGGSGPLKCWGAASVASRRVGAAHGEMGAALAAMPPLGANVTSAPLLQAAGNAYQTCFRDVAGAVFCAPPPPPNEADDLEAGLDADAFTPLPLAGPAVDMSLGASTGCAVLLSGGVQCWRPEYTGTEHNSGTGADIELDFFFVDANATALPAPAAAISAGDRHACAVLEDGSVACFGANDKGQLGLAPTSTMPLSHSPQQRKHRLRPQHRLKHQRLKRKHRQAEAQAKQQQVGEQQHDVDDDLVHHIVPLDEPASSVACGNDFCCVVTAQTSSVVCWGTQTAVVPSGSSKSPQMVLEGGVDAIAATRSAVCAITRPSGHVRCWGSNYRGALGLDLFENDSGADVDVAKLPHVDLLGARAVDLAAGAAHVCATLVRDLSDVNDDGEGGGSRVATRRLKCWGNNNDGQLGLGDRLPRGDRRRTWMLYDSSLTEVAPTMGAALPFLSLAETPTSQPTLAQPTLAPTVDAGGARGPRDDGLGSRWGAPQLVAIAGGAVLVVLGAAVLLASRARKGRKAQARQSAASNRLEVVSAPPSGTTSSTVRATTADVLAHARSPQRSSA